MADRVIQRNDTAANWQQYNPVLAQGEIGIITDGAKGYKIGDGVTRWNDLPFPANPANVVQETGSSENAVMSQKAVTEKLTELGEEVEELYNIEKKNKIDIQISSGDNHLVASNGNYVEAEGYAVTDRIQLKKNDTIYFFANVNASLSAISKNSIGSSVYLSLVVGSGELSRECYSYKATEDMYVCLCYKKTGTQSAYIITDISNDIIVLKADIERNEKSIEEVRTLDALYSKYEQSKNLLSIAEITNGKYIDNNGNVSDANNNLSLVRFTAKRGKYYQMIRFSSDEQTVSVPTTNWVFVKEDGSLFRNVSNQNMYGANYQESHYEGLTAELRTYINVSNGYKYLLVEMDSPTSSVYTTQYIQPIKIKKYSSDGINFIELGSASPWVGKNWASYGDSIVNMGYWQDYVTNELGLLTHYNRGIGGTSTTGNSSDTYYYELDSQGKFTGNMGGTYSNQCRGGSCMWERITKMFPESIKDTIDLIIIDGGNNDLKNYYNEDTDWLWKEDADRDQEWIAYATANNLPIGDFNTMNYKGAIASMIMKMQIWMPNAKLVLMSPMPTQNTTRGENQTSMQEYDASGIVNTPLKMREGMEYMAKYLSIPFIDVYGRMGANFLNRSIYTDDTIHIKEFGGKVVAGVVVGELKRILPDDYFD